LKIAFLSYSFALSDRFSQAEADGEREALHQRAGSPVVQLRAVRQVLSD